MIDTDVYQGVRGRYMSSRIKGGWAGVQIGSNSALPGMVDLSVASVDHDGTYLSIELTVSMNHPGLGGVSAGAALAGDTGRGP